MSRQGHQERENGARANEGGRDRDDASAKAHPQFSLDLLDEPGRQIDHGNAMAISNTGKIKTLSKDKRIKHMRSHLKIKKSIVCLCR